MLGFITILCLAARVAASDSNQFQAQSSSQDTKPYDAEICSLDRFRDFDFWVGSWEVTDGTGQIAGRNEIALEQNDCVLVERWQSVRGRTGLSMNYYDPALDKWRQHWIGLGLVLEMAGGMSDGSMILEGPLQYLKSGEVTLLRGIWTPLPDGRVRQHFLETRDNGTTWEDWFDGYYERVSSPSHNSANASSSPGGKL